MLINFKNFLIVLVFNIFSIQDGISQRKEFESRYSHLNFSYQLHKEILSSKSVVIIDVKNSNDYPITRRQWKDIAFVVQKGLKKSNIDGVIYYHIDDVFSGREPYVEILDEFDRRNISHGVILKFNGQMYELVILKFKDRQFLIKNEMEAFRLKGDNLENLLQELYRFCSNSKLEVNNLLIMETPEFGDLSKIVPGKVMMHYDLNFKSDKLAVPVFTDTTKIKEIMKAYPYKWGFVDSNSNDNDVFDDGFAYKLDFVYSIGENAKKMLDFDFNENETAFVSKVIIDGVPSISSKNKNAYVYKFYIKHIRTKNTFVGKYWDADYEWENALKNYFHNMNNEMKP